jgi:hypothetical protein
MLSRYTRRRVAFLRDACALIKVEKLKRFASTTFRGDAPPRGDYNFIHFLRSLKFFGDGLAFREGRRDDAH